MSSDLADLESPPAPQPTVRDPVVRADGLSVDFSGQRALDGITFAIPAGLIVGLIGPSGCGKTTLVRTMTGIISPTSGTMEVFGQDPRTFTTRQRTRFGYMPQQPTLFANLTVWANLNFVASLYGMPVTRRRRRLMRLLDLVEMGPHRSKKLADCSGGMQRRLALAATLVHEPELLYLDEPTAGVDPILRERFWEHFRGLRDQGKTILVPTQYVGEAVSCDAVAVMAHGRLITLQPPDQLARVAYNGDPISVELDGWLPRTEIEQLRALPHVRSVQHSDAGLTVVLQEQGAADSLRQHLVQTGVNVVSIKPLEPTFDDIFVKIIENYGRAMDPAA
jgi:ABC-2 type transport system ATP-binding protein